MPDRRKTARSRILQALAVALAASGFAGAARAQESSTMRDVLGAIGFIEKERAPIHYRERAPLVLPPRTDLPVPASRGALREDAAWPKDQEITEREGRAARERGPITRGEQGRQNDNRMELSIYEMRAGRRPGAGVPTENEYKPGDNNRSSFWLDPLKLLEGKKDDTETLSMVEPERSLLSDPPSGYRRAPGGSERAPTAPRPYNPDRDEADPRLFQRQQAGR